nr:hypothetical protein [uncultured Chryseobacterium sp.]
MNTFKIVHALSKVLLTVGLAMSCKVFSQEQLKYIPFRKGNLWGLCDTGKFIVVQPQFNSISWYGSSVGGFHAEKNGRFGIIDNSATPIMPFISEKPIFTADSNYVVFDGFDYYNYSVKTKMRSDRYIMTESFVINDRWNKKDDPFFVSDTPFKPTLLKWTDLDEQDMVMLKPYENESVYRILFKENFLEIFSGDSPVGIYIPKIRKLYKNTPQTAYAGWQLYNGKPYLLTTDSYRLFGLVDEFSREIYAIKYTSITVDEGNQLVFLSEQDPEDPENLLFKTILPNNRMLNGKFLPEKNVFKNGWTFGLYYTIINGEKNYAGEDGTLFYEG